MHSQYFETLKNEFKVEKYCSASAEDIIGVVIRIITVLSIHQKCLIVLIT